MKIFKLLLITCLLQVILSAEELKVTILSAQNVNYAANGTLGGTPFFRILCINGYQWLQYNITNGSVSQMFEMNNGVIHGTAIPIKCQN